jgi:hypothetical protein
VNIRAKECVFRGGAGVLRFSQSDRFLAEQRPLSNERSLALLRRLVRWSEQRNL